MVVVRLSRLEFSLKFRAGGEGSRVVQRRRQGGFRHPGTNGRASHVDQCFVTRIHSALLPVAPSNVLASTMTDPTQRLPLEMLAEILRHVPGLDVLRFKQVRSQPLFRGQINRA